MELVEGQLELRVMMQTEINSNAIHLMMIVEEWEEEEEVQVEQAVAMQVMEALPVRVGTVLVQADAEVMLPAQLPEEPEQAVALPAVRLALPMEALAAILLKWVREAVVPVVAVEEETVPRQEVPEAPEEDM